MKKHHLGDGFATFILFFNVILALIIAILAFVGILNRSPDSSFKVEVNPRFYSLIIVFVCCLIPAIYQTGHCISINQRPKKFLHSILYLEIFYGLDHEKLKKSLPGYEVYPIDELEDYLDAKGFQEDQRKQEANKWVLNRITDDEKFIETKRFYQEVIQKAKFSEKYFLKLNNRLK